MFILSSVSSGLELQLVNHTSIYEDTKSKYKGFRWNI